MSFKDSQHGCSRAGGSCVFPSCSLSRRGRSSPTFSSRRPPRRLFCHPASPVRNPPPTRTFFQCRCAFEVAGSTVPSACRALDGCPTFRGQTCSRRTVGTPTVCLTRGEPLARYPDGCKRWPAAGFTPPQPGCREQLTPHSSPDDALRDPVTQHLSVEERGCTPRRPSAEFSKVMLSGALGPGLLKAVFSRTRVPS